MVHAREGTALPNGVKLPFLEGLACNIPQRLDGGVLDGEGEAVKLLQKFRAAEAL